MTAERPCTGRRDLLQSLDGLRRNIDRSGAIEGFDRFEQQAMDLLPAPWARDALDFASSNRPRSATDTGSISGASKRSWLVGWWRRATAS